MIKTLKVALGQRSYAVWVGSNAISKLGSWAHPSRRAFLIYDRRLTQARKKAIATLESAGWSVQEISVEAGENLKSTQAISRVYGELIKKGADRKSVIFALGGGSVGDAVGFIAATYMRGIPWVGIPTTLLSQVDSSVGGKTAINHPSSKNLIGVIYQPSLVICDTEFLKTLSTREIVSGLGEALKYGLIYDFSFFSYLDRNYGRILKKQTEPLVHTVFQSLKFKCKVVSKDECDVTGVREALNFGHTFGHALEAFTKYRTYQHGEAVIHGMRFALALSLVRGLLTKADYDRANHILVSFEIPPLPVEFSKKANVLKALALMKKDKKAENSFIRFVLLKALGRATSDRNVTQAHLLQAYELMCQETR